MGLVFWFYGRDIVFMLCFIEGKFGKKFDIVDVN